MTDEKDDLFDALRELFDNPAVRTGLGLASIALLPLAVKMESTPEAHERRRKRMAEQEARREQDKREHEQWSARAKARNAYMFNGGPGSKLMEELGRVSVGPADPFPDASYTKLNEPWRHGFQVVSEQAGATLRGSWSIREPYGGLQLKLPDGTSWGLPTLGLNSGRQWSLDKPPVGYRPRFDLEAAHVAARLSATATGRPETISLMRPEYPDIQKRVWRDYLDAHPELGEDYSEVLRRPQQAGRSSDKRD
jgi:hypothetical protein